LELAGGAAGFGEASSSIAMAFQTVPRMAATARALFRRFRAADVRDIEMLVRAVWKKGGAFPTAAAAFETALWDALARAMGVPFVDLWGGGRRALTTLITVPVAAPDDVGALSRAAAKRGFRKIKIKINGRDGLDRERLRRACRAAPRAALLLDANQSHRPASLQRLLADARRDGIAIELVEEPFRKHDWAALRRYARGKTSAVPLLLDESVQTPADARRAAEGRSADGVNVKLAKSGLLRGKEILNIFAKKPRSPLMIGCMAESALGLTASVHWASATGVFDYADLDSDLLLRPGAARGAYARRGPEVILPRRLPKGLGVQWP